MYVYLFPKYSLKQTVNSRTIFEETIIKYVILNGSLSIMTPHKSLTGILTKLPIELISVKN